jgi:hypothetical protein
VYDGDLVAFDGVWGAFIRILALSRGNVRNPRQRSYRGTNFGDGSYRSTKENERSAGSRFTYAG